MWFIDRRGYSLVVATILNSVIHSKSLTYFLSRWLICFKISFLLDYNILKLDRPIPAEYSERFRGTIISIDNLFMKMMGTVNPIDRLQKLQSSPFFVIILFILLFLTLISVSLLRFGYFRNVNTETITYKPRKPFYFNMMSILIYNYDFFFIIIFNIFILSVSCVKIAREELVDQNGEGFLKLESYRVSESAVTIKYDSLVGLNQSIICKSLSHYYLIGMASIMMVFNLVIKFTSHLVLSHRPNPRLVNSIYGHSYLFHILIISCILTYKIFLLGLHNVTSTQVDSFYWFSFFVFLADLWVQGTSKPFYEAKMNGLRLFESILLISTSILILYVRNSKSSLTLLSKSVIWFVLMFIIALKFCKNLFGDIDILRIGPERALIDGKVLFKVSYFGFKFIDLTILNNADKSDENERLRTLSFFSSFKSYRSKNTNPFWKNSQRKGINEVIQKSKKYFGKSKEAIRSKVGILDYNDNGGDVESNRRASRVFQDPIIEKKNISMLEITYKMELSQKNFAMPSAFGGRIKAAQNNQTSDSYEKNGSGTVALGKKTKEETMKNQSSKRIQDLQSKLHEKHELDDSDQPSKNEVPEFQLDKYLTKGIPENNSMTLIIKQINEVVCEKYKILIGKRRDKYEELKDLIKLDSYVSANYSGNIIGAIMRMSQLKYKVLALKYKIEANDDVQAKQMLENEKRKTNSAWLDYDIILSEISLWIKENLDSANFLLRETITRLPSQNIQSENHEKVRIFECFRFLNRYEKVKKDIKACKGIKLEFLRNIAENNEANFSKISSDSKKFHIKCSKIESDFERLSTMVSPRFTGIKLIEGFFHIFLSQNLKKGRKLVDKAVSSKITLNYNILMPEGAFAGSQIERCIIGVTGEKSRFHSIDLVTANLKTILRYHPKNLIGQDLTVLIPDPIKSRHKDLLSQDLSSGAMYQRKTPLPIIVLDKLENALLCKLTAKINYKLEQGIQFLGALDFDFDDSKESLIVIDKECKVLYTDNQSRKYFEKGRKLEKYSKRLKSEIMEMNIITDLKLRRPDITVEEIVLDSILFKKAKSYYQAMVGGDFQIQDKRTQIRNMKMVVNELYVNRVQTVLRTVHFKMGKPITISKGSATGWGNEILGMEFNSSNSIGDQEDAFSDIEMRSIQMVDRVFSERRDKLLNSFLLDIEIKLKMAESINVQDHVDKFVTVLENKASLNFNYQGSPSSNILQGEIVDEESFRESNSEDKYVSPKHAGKLSKGAEGRFEAGTYDLTKTLMKTFQRINKSFKKDTFKSIKRAGEIREKRAREELNNDDQEIDMKIPVNYQASTYLSRLNQESHNIEIISRNIHAKLKYSTCSRFVVFFSVIVLLSVLMQFSLGYFKFSLSDMVYGEIKNKLLAADLNSWSVWGLSNLIILMDTSRMVYEGIITDDIYLEFTGKYVLEANSIRKKTMNLGNYAYIWGYNHLMKNASVGMMIDRKFFSEPEGFTVWSPGDIDWTNPPESANWTSKRMNFYEAWSYISPIIDMYTLRNDTTYLYKQIGSDRDMDLLSEFLRRNGGNQALEMQMKAGQQIYKYFRNICKFNRYIESYGNIFSICLLIFTTLIFGLMVALMARKMRNYYRTLFTIQVSFILTSDCPPGGREDAIREDLSKDR